MCECLEYDDGSAYVCEVCWPLYQEAFEDIGKIKDVVEKIVERMLSAKELQGQLNGLD
jgi:hypothetical protein